MGIGTRNTAEQLIGDSDFDDSDMGGFFTTSRRRKNKKHRKSSRHKKRRVHKVRRAPKHSRKGKRKGMSREFLRNLRRKHHLGEFKK